jgi:hypothetical protein
MVDIDVDDIAEVNYLKPADEASETEQVQVIFKDGTEKVYRGEELPEVYQILNHWTPPMA